MSRSSVPVVTSAGGLQELRQIAIHAIPRNTAASRIRITSRRDFPRTAQPVTPLQFGLGQCLTTPSFRSTVARIKGSGRHVGTATQTRTTTVSFPASIATRTKRPRRIRTTMGCGTMFTIALTVMPVTPPARVSRAKANSEVSWVWSTQEQCQQGFLSYDRADALFHYSFVGPRRTLKGFHETVL